MSRGSAAALAAAVLSAAACAPAEGPLMAPGQDCLRCHDGGAARRWTAAGTWAGANQRVTIRDANGKSFTLRTNRVGNFYTAEPLAFPLTVRVGTQAMPDPVTYGGCNECHGSGGTALVTGPLMAPGQDCLSCHDGAAAGAFTAAGTWGGAGATVTITDSAGRVVTLVTNEVGNFYTAEKLAFPLTVRVGNETMPDPVTWGGCNRCHVPGGSAGGG